MNVRENTVRKPLACELVPGGRCSSHHGCLVGRSRGDPTSFSPRSSVPTSQRTSTPPFPTPRDPRVPIRRLTVNRAARGLTARARFGILATVGAGLGTFPGREASLSRGISATLRGISTGDLPASCPVLCWVATRRPRCQCPSRIPKVRLDGESRDGAP